MTKEQVRDVVADYIIRLKQLGARPARDDTKATELPHLLWMCYEMLKFLPPSPWDRARGWLGLRPAGKWDKAQRWLGFVQGGLAAQGVFTVAEMRGHNRALPGAA